MGRRNHGCRRGRHDLVLTPDLDPGGTLSLLKYLTRLLFLAILASGAVVLAVSVMMLTQCRKQVRVVEDVVLNSYALCTHLTIPAYFACVVIVVTIFGFGCVGRKVSGLLLVGVSVVAMVIAVEVVVNQECVEDVQDVQQALVTKLQQCRLFRGLNSSIDDLHSTQAHRFEYFSDLAVCQNIASSLTTLCRPFFAVDSSINDSDSREEPDRTMNETGVERCARQVSHSIYSLCMQDTENVNPILLTMPIFYMGIGVALVYIKHAHVKAKYSVLSRTRSSVGTNTDRSSVSPDSGRHMLSTCISSLCVSHSLCFTCLLRGCSCCSDPASTLRPSSRLSFQLREIKEGGGDEEEVEGEEVGMSVGMLRRSSTPKLHEGLHLMDECV